MLVTMKEVLKIAEERNIAVGSFNTPNLENIIAVLEVATRHNVPVILMHAEVHEEVVPIRYIAPVMIALAKAAAIPVCVHLDHCETLEYLEKSLELGFTSVMYDGSLLPYDENVANTKAAVAIAKKYGASVEAEIGILGGREAGSSDTRKVEDMYTDPDLAVKFVLETGIDALAASFGTAHGFYASAPKLDFERIEKINQMVDVPLVMHGGSGVSPEDYLRAIDLGIRKINYYSYMAKAGTEGVKRYLAEHPDVMFYHELVNAAIADMTENVEKAIAVFSKNA
ncbi:class II fructose-bisphosphate aldolase [Candidatus Epulonipiscium viviparus]|uniref:class II fructose-bisphosphate aldolase n=1 Tax=Candidatus Epulonipiscium viviparus TaxID=420336 RepID=UPI0027381097|nr:class II fructose-bisphosphate aldolase [Candidatus Epulopiscium viviparus]